MIGCCLTQSIFFFFFFFLLIIVDICGPLLLSFIRLKTQNIITNQEYKLSSLAVKVERVLGSGDLSDIQPLRRQLSPLGGILYLWISWSLPFICPSFTEYLLEFYSLLLSLIALCIELQIPSDWLNQFRLVHLQMAQREKHKNKQNGGVGASSFSSRAFGNFLIQRTTSPHSLFLFSRFHTGGFVPSPLPTNTIWE